MSFSAILGHDRQIEVLRRNIATGQLPPAYLFHGDEGVGKFLTAMTLAKAVNCAGDMFGEVPCGTCQSCHNIEARCHPNVSVLELEVNPDTGKMRQEIVISQVRAAQAFLTLKSVGSGKKVLIVDGAHLMNEEASNAFLKTLEEPPDNSHVVLVTSRPSVLLPTILSRCRAVSFQPLPEALVVRLLTERKGFLPEEASLVARMTGGRVGEAFSADPSDIAERRTEFLEALGIIVSGGPTAILQAAEEAAKKEGGLEDFVVFGTAWFRDLMLILVGADEALTYNRDMAELSGWAGRTTAARCEEALAMLRETGRALERTFNRRLLAEDLFFRLREEALS